MPVVSSTLGHVMEMPATDMHTISTTMLHTEKGGTQCAKSGITIMPQYQK